MMFRNVCGVALAVTLGAFGCSQNPPAQQPTTTGATSPYESNAGNTSAGQNGAEQNGVHGEMNGNAGVGVGGTGADVNGGGGVGVGENGASIGSDQQNGQSGSMQGGQMQGQNTFQNDGEIAAYLQAVNKGEEEQARLAVQKAKDPQVKAFAQFLLMHHQQLQQNEQRMLSSQNVTPQAGQATNQLQNQAQQELSSLQSKSGRDFDQAYIDAQVQEHQMVLNALDSEMIPAAQNSQFKQELTNVRSKLQTHLQRAQALQQRLNGNGSNP